MCYLHKTSNHNDNIFSPNLFLLRYISQYLVLFSCNSSSPVCLSHLLNFSQCKISLTLERQSYFAGLTMMHASSAIHFPFYCISQVSSFHMLLVPDSLLTVLTEILRELFPRAFNMNTHWNTSLNLTRLCTQCFSLFCPRSSSEHLIPSPANVFC